MSKFKVGDLTTLAVQSVNSTCWFVKEDKISVTPLTYQDLVDDDSKHVYLASNIFCGQLAEIVAISKSGYPILYLPYLKLFTTNFEDYYLKPLTCQQQKKSKTS